MSEITTSAELADHLDSEIESRRLLPGERIPPVRAMADDLGLAPNTVAAAYRALGRRGLLVARGRSGTFVADDRPRFTATPVIPNGVVDLALGNPDPELLPDTSAVLSRMRAPQTLYGDVAVLPELEEASRRWLADLPGDLAVVSGALDGVERVLSAHLQPGDRVGVEDPGWPAVFDLLSAMRLRPVPIAVDDEGPIVADVERVAGELEAMVITSRMQNPTGACISGERAGALAAILADHPDVLTVEDDHAPAIAGCDLHTIGPGRNRWAVVQSFSKSLSPDLRLATVSGDAETIEAVSARQAVGPGWVSHILQRAAASLLDDRSVRSRLKEATRRYDERRHDLARLLGERGIDSHGRSGLNLWIPVPDESVAIARCLDAGFAIRAGEAFRLQAPTAVRVTTARLDHGRAQDVAAAIHAAVASSSSATRSG